MLKLNRITHIYSAGKEIECKALDEINITIPLNNFVVLLGESGSGKTTLLKVMAGLLEPSSGMVEYNEEDIYKLNDKNLSMFRRDNIGFVFQHYFLDNSFSAFDNIRVPLFLHKNITKQEQIDKTKDVLKQVGLQDKAMNKPTQLSGGQCQRVAIARAMINNPKFIMADEPTGNLDSATGDAIIEILRNQVGPNRSVIMVTHNSKYIRDNDIVYQIKDGKVLLCDG